MIKPMKNYKSIATVLLFSVVLLASACVTHVHDRNYGYRYSRPYPYRRYVVVPPPRVIVVPSHRYYPPRYSYRHRSYRKW